MLCPKCEATLVLQMDIPADETPIAWCHNCGTLVHDGKAVGQCNHVVCGLRRVPTHTLGS